MKDKKWAQREVDRYLSYEGVIEARDALVFAKGVINQLDEPEVLSQEWIDKNVVHVRGLGDIIESETVENLIVPKQESEVLSQEWIDENTFVITDEDGDDYAVVENRKLKDKLVPKQEEKDMQYYWREATEFLVNERVFGHEGRDYIVIEKPVIPKFVAEYINLVKIDISLMKILAVANRRNELPEWEKEYDWISANDEMFARAWLNGYTVESEPLYYAMVKGNELLGDSSKYWSHSKYDSEDLFISYETRDDSPIVVKNSKKHWDDLGVNDSNADFVRWYKMEKEQKYYVDLDTAAYVAKWNGNDQVDIYTDGISGSDEFEFHLTEQEIKNYDERFWPFAKPVE